MIFCVLIVKIFSFLLLFRILIIEVSIVDFLVLKFLMMNNFLLKDGLFFVLISKDELKNKLDFVK